MRVEKGWRTWRDKYGEWRAEKDGQTLNALSHGRLVYLIDMHNVVKRSNNKEKKHV
jgi:hypothetical protein|tara:strand:+ start:442 stop:609 length:168 start_codon:yes stop_codon:yes gene_type:complete